MSRRALSLACCALTLALLSKPGSAQTSCEDLPPVLDCRLILLTNLESTACPKGDIPYVAPQGGCLSLTGEELTLLGAGDEAWGYEYSAPALCPSLPLVFGPSSVGIFNVAGPGCPVPGSNCSAALGGNFAVKWCYRYRHYADEGTTCSVHTDAISMGTVDFVGGSSAGVVDAAELSAFSALLGTRCGYYSGSGPKYNPIVDFNKDGFIDAGDLSLLAAHWQHNCSQWMPSKTTGDSYPFEVFDVPEMQAAMLRAGVDRDFVVDVWRRNGPDQRLFYKADKYDREQHMAEVRARKAPVADHSWSQVRILYR